MGVIRSLLDWLFAIYFITHIPIAIFFDSQMLLPSWLYPEVARNTVLWYSKEYKDPMVVAAPVWFKSFIVCEITMQLPFFFFGAYAFVKGGCRWIRTPLLIYASHVVTTMLPIMAHIMLHDFSKDEPKLPGPSSLEDRLVVLAIYSAYFIIPVMMILRMLLDKEYCGKQKSE
ncbi:sigma intracellular receptor 2-like [Lineus longissimus]|uniref:sigma intracellular receptor 2-like n=1 Tax=Lineus longissimus TaxID=88925 RepID=UPI002B4DE8B3